MAVEGQLVNKVIEIARNVTGRVDVNDPLFTNTKMLDYLNTFLQTEKPSDVQLFQNRTWYEFSIDENKPDPFPVDLDFLSFTKIEPPAYCAGFKLFWYQDPALFYDIWPETQTYQPSRPTYVLYYNNALVFRNPPDTTYNIKIAAYQIDLALATGTNIPSAYQVRYLAYGMALDIFADFGELDQYAAYAPVFQKYKNDVLARTHDQFLQQRATPRF